MKALRVFIVHESYLAYLLEKSSLNDDVEKAWKIIFTFKTHRANNARFRRKSESSSVGFTHNKGNKGGEPEFKIHVT